MTGLDPIYLYQSKAGDRAGQARATAFHAPKAIFQALLLSLVLSLGLGFAKISWASGAFDGIFNETPESGLEIDTSDPDANPFYGAETSNRSLYDDEDRFDRRLERMISRLKSRSERKQKAALNAIYDYFDDHPRARQRERKKAAEAVFKLIRKGGSRGSYVREIQPDSAVQEALDLFVRDRANVFKGIYKDLSRANLEGANLSKANLIRANLSGASLVNANLERATLNYANLERVKLFGANLKEISLQGARLRNTSFKGIHLKRVTLERVHLESTDFSGARLEDVNFFGSYLDRANFQKAKVSRSSFKAARLDGANFRSARLSRASFEQASLRGANFRRSSLKGVKMIQAHLERAHFGGAKLSKVDLSGAYLKETDLRGVNLKASRYQKAFDLNQVMGYEGMPSSLRRSWEGSANKAKRAKLKESARADRRRAMIND